MCSTIDCESESEKVCKIQASPSSPMITINVGGIRYSTSKETFANFPSSMLGQMFGKDHAIMLQKNSDGEYFVDRDGKLFRYILQFYRNQTVFHTWIQKYDELIMEADFFALDDMVMQLNKLLETDDKSKLPERKSHVVIHVSNINRDDIQNEQSKLSQRKPRGLSVNSQTTIYSTDDSIDFSLDPESEEEFDQHTEIDPTYFTMEPDF